MNVLARWIFGFLLLVVFFTQTAFAGCPGIHQTDFVGYALSPNAARIAALAQDGTLFWWDVAAGKLVKLLDCVHKSDPFDQLLVFSPDSARLAVLVDNAIQVFDLPSGSVVARLSSLKQKKYETFVFSGDGRRIDADDFDSATVWDVEAQTELAFIAQRMDGHTLALNQQGTVLATSEDPGIVLRDVGTATVLQEIELAERQWAERLLFVNDDKWIAALTAQSLPLETPKQQRYKYHREIGVWKTANGEKLPVHVETEEIQYSLTLVQSHLLAFSDYRDHLRFWNFETGALESSWNTPAGHPSSDGKLLLRPGGSPGQLELWELGSLDEKARAFVYHSPNCAENLASGADDGKPQFKSLFIADGTSEEGASFGTFNSIGYVAQDCTPLNYSRSTYSSPERAKQEFEKVLSSAKEILEKGRARDLADDGSRGLRAVMRFAGKHSSPEVGAVIWTRGSTFFMISSSSLEAALALERKFFEQEKKE